MRSLLSRVFRSDSDKSDGQNLQPEHRFLLSLFLRPRDTKTITGGGWGSMWKDSLNEDPAAVLARFKKLAYLRRATMREALTEKLVVATLKSDLRARGLKVSGRKLDLIDRLMDADPQHCEERTRNHNVLICSESGAEIGNQYIHERAEKREVAERTAFHHLGRRELDKAAHIMRQFSDEGVSLSLLEIRGDSLEQLYRELLHHLFSRGLPQILGQKNSAAAEPLLLAGAMAILDAEKPHKNYLPEGFHSGSHLGDEVAIRMIRFAAQHRRNMSRLPEANVGHVCVQATGNGCETCAALDGKRFRLDEIPELPYAGCTCECGCRCIAQPILDEYD